MDELKLSKAAEGRCMSKAATSRRRIERQYLPPPSWGRVGVGVVPSSDELVELNQRPLPTLPRLGGGKQQALCGIRVE